MFGRHRIDTSDVDPSLVEDSLPPPIDITASYSANKRSAKVKRGDWEAGPLNSKIDTSLTQRVFQVLDIIRLILTCGGGGLCIRSGRRDRGLGGGQMRWRLGV